MAISDNKITNAEIAEVHVQAAPDTLTGSAQQNKAVFDAYSDLIKEKHNSLIDDIDGEYASNWRNGSQTGSVRTTGSEEEGDNYTIGQYAAAEGRQTKASGSNSHAEGFRTQASKYSSHAEGHLTIADGNEAHAEGRETLASGDNSHAEGLFANATGDNSHAEGNSTEASGDNSHAEGHGTIASSNDQHVSGRYNIEDTNNVYAEIIGNGTSLGRGNGRTLDWNGNEVLAGKLTVGTEPENNKDVATKGYVDTGLAGKVDKVTGKGLSTEDYTTSEKAKLSNIEAGAEVNVQADWNQSDSNADDYIKNKPTIKEGTGAGSIIENDTNNIASGAYSHAEGYRTGASGNYSHAEGDSTEAIGLYAHAEGTTTSATGIGSHTEGYLTKAAESYTHANGVGTEAHAYAETVIGTYNDYDAMNEPYAFVIGNGYEDGDRSNAHTTDWQGNAWYAGEVTDGTGNVLSEKVDKETGKGLSTEDYTTAEKTKLAGIGDGAEANVQSDWAQPDTTADDYIKNKPPVPTKTSDLTNDSDYTTKLYVDGKLPTGSASGTIANIKDGADGMPMKSLTATIVPKQSGTGTPSPDNVRPISGWESVETSVCGVNVWDEEWESGYISNSTGENVATVSQIRGKNYISTIPNASYYFKSPSGVFVYFYDANKEYIGVYGSGTRIRNNTITLGEDVRYIRISMPSDYGTTYNNDISINYPSTDHSYHAYNGHTHTTELGRTVYGGTVDLVSGVLTDKMKLIDLGSLSWSYQSTWESWYTDYIADVKGTNTGTETPNFVSDRLEAISTNAGFAPQAQGFTGITSTTRSSSGCRILVKNGSTTEPPTGQLCYELATPQTYTLTPQQINTLAGVNNVWADSGDCSIEYVRDIGLALDNLLPDNPTTDGTYTLVCTVSDGKATLAWQSSGASLSSPLSMSSPTVLNSTNDTETRNVSLTEEEGESNEIR